MDNYVVLVDEKNNILGTAPKLETHNSNTPLHLGFSIFIFNNKGEFLIQQRSRKKKTWPGVWSNSCCGHPKLEEDSIMAAKRHLESELGLKKVNIEIILPDYRYKVEKYGIVENEICPVMVGITAETPTLNSDEVENIKWLRWNDWNNEIKNNPDNYSQWSVEETNLLNESEKFQLFLKNTTSKLINK